jgi:ubiquinol-cytochrome c reductase iron-sulfur subunit
MTELHHDELNDPKKRDMLVLASQAMAALGAGALLWPFVDSMNPAADVLALASTEVNLGSIQAGQEVRVMWRGKPVFIRHRTEQEIKEARAVAVDTLPDPQEDKERVKEGKDQWIVMLGVCTHLGCVPLGNNASGRIRKGPAPANLVVPDYTFTDDTHIKIG